MSTTTAIRLKEVMSLRGLRQADILRMAQPYCEKYKIKMGKSDLSQFVNGKTSPGQWKLTILGLALNVSEAWLMGLDVPMERKTTPITLTERDEIDQIIPSDSDMEFSEPELHLIALYRELNTEGQEKLVGYADDLVTSGKYIKTDSIGMVQGA